MLSNTSVHYILSEYLSQTWVRPIILYANPVLTLLGLLGNSFCFITILLRQLYAKSPMFVFFAYLSLMDFFYVLSDGIYSNEYLLGIRFHSRYDIACQFVLWIGHSGMVSSSWILVAVTAYKLYGLTRPVAMRKHDRKLFPFIICFGVLAVAFSLGSCVFWIKGVVTDSISPNVSVSFCYALDEYVASQYGAVLMILYSLGPGVILTILSIGICVNFTKSLLRHKRLMQETATVTNKNGTGQKVSNTFTAAKNSVAMLLPLSVVHIICTVPLLLYITLQSSMHHGFEFYFVTDRLWLLNHSMNVYVQLIVSRFYRDAMLPCIVK